MCARRESSECIITNNPLKVSTVCYEITIDSNINASSIKNENMPITLPDTILEFKLIPAHEISFRNFIRPRSNSLRVQKYSKYVRSFIALEEAGRFNHLKRLNFERI